MSGRGFLYCLLVALLISGCLATAVGAVMPLREQGSLAAVSYGAEALLIFGGGVGLALAVVPPVFGMIYRYDQPVFRQMMRPRSGLHEPVQPVPPLSWATLRQLARMLVGAGAAAEAVAQAWARMSGAAGWPLGLVVGTGAYAAACLLAGGAAYLRLRDGRH